MLSPFRLSSVCLWSIKLVHPTQAVVIFCNFSSAFVWYLGHPLTCTEKNLEIVPGEPSDGGVKPKRGIAKYSDFGPIERYISEIVQDTR